MRAASLVAFLAMVLVVCNGRIHEGQDRNDVGNKISGGDQEKDDLHIQKEAIENKSEVDDNDDKIESLSADKETEEKDMDKNEALNALQQREESQAEPRTRRRRCTCSRRRRRSYLRRQIRSRRSYLRRHFRSRRSYLRRHFRSRRSYLRRRRSHLYRRRSHFHRRRSYWRRRRSSCSRRRHVPKPPVPKPTSCPSICKQKFKAVGCFKDKHVKNKRPLPLLISTIRDKNSKVFHGPLLNWKKYDKSLKTLMCHCAKLAKSRGFKYFGVQYYGECWSGNNAEKTFSKDGRSTECVNSHFKKCDIRKDCSCAGKQFTSLVYKIE